MVGWNERRRRINLGLDIETGLTKEQTQIKEDEKLIKEIFSETPEKTKKELKAEAKAAKKNK